jgi:hypothetical protein
MTNQWTEKISDIDRAAFNYITIFPVTYMHTFRIIYQIKLHAENMEQNSVFRIKIHARIDSR